MGDKRPKLMDGMILYNPEEGGVLWAVAFLTKHKKPKAVLVRSYEDFSAKMTMKSDRLPEGWTILKTNEIEDLIGDNLSRVGLS